MTTQLPRPSRADPSPPIASGSRNALRGTDTVYLWDYADGWEAEERLAAYFRFYSHQRIHQALGYRTPAEVYRQRN